ncbi:MAG TPA: hypothetical protein VET85_12825 [Stellaceae bacterium]|nr:hypothetical protein [Stellaceae bacterium]
MNVWRNRLALAVAILAASGNAFGEEASRSPDASEMPLFAAVLTFCFDTGARPDAVKAAIEAAGGTLHSSGATDWPFAMTVTGWDYVLGDHDMIISAVTSRIPASKERPEINMNDCIVTSFASEDASVASLGKWVGVPPSGNSSAERTTYHFQLVGGRRMAMDPTQSATRTARAEGREWNLVVVQRRSDQVTVQVNNIKATSQPPH